MGLSADVWGLGALAFFMLSATSPFRGETDKETLNNLTFVRFMTKFLYDEVTSEALNFNSNRMNSFKEEWRFRREEQSRVLPQEVVSAFGAPNVKSDSLSSLE